MSTGRRRKVRWSCRRVSLGCLVPAVDWRGPPALLYTQRSRRRFRVNLGAPEVPPSFCKLLSDHCLSAEGGYCPFAVAEFPEYPVGVLAERGDLAHDGFGVSHRHRRQEGAQRTCFGADLAPAVASC